MVNVESNHVVVCWLNTVSKHLSHTEDERVCKETWCVILHSKITVKFVPHPYWFENMLYKQQHNWHVCL